MLPSHFVERNFYLFMVDAMHLLEASVRSGGSCARSSLLTSVVALECCANICVANIRGNDFRGDIDKLPVLSKFDAFARSEAKELDRGRVEVQQIKELIKCRDAIVHLKPKTRQVKSTMRDGRYGKQTELHSEIIRSFSNTLKISDNIADWRHPQAAAALRATTQFLKYYFVDLLGHSGSQTYQLLAGGRPNINEENLRHERELEAIVKAGQTENLDILFLLPKNMQEILRKKKKKV